MKVLYINGPNLNLLGQREPEHYGHETLADIEAKITSLAQTLGHQVLFFQSNAEHLLIEKIQTAKNEGIDYIVINPGAFTHTSIALRDSLLSVAIPFIEVHLANVYTRETFRHHSYFSDIAKGVIIGFGSKGYELALYAIQG